MLVLNLGESGLAVANVQALREHCFMVETGTPDDFHYFAAESDQERKEWKHAIKHRKAKSRFNAGIKEQTDEEWVSTIKNLMKRYLNSRHWTGKRILDMDARSSRAYSLCLGRRDAFASQIA